jgi:Protein of unknown function (DUF2695)
MTDPVVAAAEQELAGLSRELTEPRERECLRCYLLRMLGQFGCDNTHRWTLRWRDARAPRAHALLRRLAANGGICCDCEVILNVYRDYPETGPPLPCVGVSRAGSTKRCDLPRATPAAGAG